MLLTVARQFHANLESILDMHIVEHLTLVNDYPDPEIRSTADPIYQFAPQEWISSKLRPTHIEKLFLNLGARPVALNLSESLEPTNPSPDGRHSFVVTDVAAHELTGWQSIHFAIGDV